MGFIFEIFLLHCTQRSVFNVNCAFCYWFVSNRKHPAVNRARILTLAECVLNLKIILYLDLLHFDKKKTSNPSFDLTSCKFAIFYKCTKQQTNNKLFFHFEQLKFEYSSFFPMNLFLIVFLQLHCTLTYIEQCSFMFNDTFFSTSFVRLFCTK